MQEVVLVVQYVAIIEHGNISMEAKFWRCSVP